MWEVNRDKKLFVMDVGEDFDSLGNKEKKMVYESAKRMKESVELELARRVEEIHKLAESLTDKEWMSLPEKVYDFLIEYTD